MAGHRPEPTKAGDLAIAEDLGHQLVRLVNMASRAKAQLPSIAAEGIERAAYSLLAHLVRQGAQRTTALADAVHSDTSTVSRQVSSLVQHGLVERKAIAGGFRNRSGRVAGVFLIKPSQKISKPD